jgi:hypothetical protein
MAFRLQFGCWVIQQRVVSLLKITKNRQSIFMILKRRISTRKAWRDLP